MMNYVIALFCLSLAAIANISCAQTELLATAPHIRYQIISERSHKTNLFTQGLEVKNGNFYESSGLYAKSQIVAYPIQEPAATWAKITAPFTQKQRIPDRYFAEGLTLFNNKLYVLTWQEGTAFVYDANNFSLIKNLHYQGEGWGLTNNGKHLIRSDGSNTLFFHTAESFSLEKTISVKYQQAAIKYLNELEYAEGFIWANIWHDNRVVKINPATGDVIGVIDFSVIAQNLRLKNAESVLNGIAYDADKKAFWITGKQWPKMFLVKIEH
jgi:glutaminyl-peptide cyclotransferase